MDCSKFAKFLHMNSLCECTCVRVFMSVCMLVCAYKSGIEYVVLFSEKLYCGWAKRGCYFSTSGIHIDARRYNHQCAYNWKLFGNLFHERIFFSFVDLDILSLWPVEHWLNISLVYLIGICYICLNYCLDSSAKVTFIVNSDMLKIHKEREWGQEWDRGKERDMRGGRSKIAK